jgi:hypothetical protein
MFSMTNGLGDVACKTVWLFIMDETMFFDDEPSTFKVFNACIVGWQ